jgi:hypothetical protein
VHLVADFRLSLPHLKRQPVCWMCPPLLSCNSSSWCLGQSTHQARPPIAAFSHKERHDPRGGVLPMGRCRESAEDVEHPTDRFCWRPIATLWSSLSCASILSKTILCLKNEQIVTNVLALWNMHFYIQNALHLCVCSKMQLTSWVDRMWIFQPEVLRF